MHVFNSQMHVGLIEVDGTLLYTTSLVMDDAVVVVVVVAAVVVGVEVTDETEE